MSSCPATATVSFSRSVTDLMCEPGLTMRPSVEALRREQAVLFGDIEAGQSMDGKS